jgi:LuxR family transcriptional regulator, activator of tox operons
MLVLENHQKAPKAATFSSAVPSLIAELGTPKFENALSEVAKAVFQCKQLTAFAFGKSSAPRVVGLYALERTEAVRRAAEKYTKVHWTLDPSNIFANQGLTTGHSYGVILSDNDVKDEDFRRDCYTKPGVSHRLSVLTEFRGECVKISFHRTEALGMFPEENIHDLLEQSTILASLLVRHSEMATEQSLPDHEPERFEIILGVRCPQLTNRERRVCSLIAVGMSSEAIALTLDISINTVLTFRRRAYARLNISTQNELMRLLFSDRLQ